VTGRSILGALVGFHAWLFWAHAASGRLLEPGTAFRWIAGALILAGFLWLRRSGRLLTSDRRALVLWLLVALLHAHAAGVSGNLPASAVPETVQLVLSQLASVPLALLGTVLFGLLRRRRREDRSAPSPGEVPRFLCGTPQSGNIFQFSPRPPPQLLCA
jgi:hypothetical protein